jgi:hypothetical protein
VSKRRVVVSQNAIASVEAVLEHGDRPRSDEEKHYNAVLETCVFRSVGHAQKPASDAVVQHQGKRLYTVTAIASSARFGGTRIVTVCDTFERAKEIIETNEGDIFECSYSLVVIDTVVAGWLYFNLDEQYWYLWVGSVHDGSYKAINRPKAYENTIGIGGIG